MPSSSARAIIDAIVVEVEAYLVGGQLHSSEPGQWLAWFELQRPIRGAATDCTGHPWPRGGSREEILTRLDGVEAFERYRWMMMPAICSPSG